MKIIELGLPQSANTIYIYLRLRSLVFHIYHYTDFKKIKHPDIPLITLHDGIATSVGNEKTVQKMMKDLLLNEVRIKANVEIEWSKWGIDHYEC